MRKQMATNNAAVLSVCVILMVIPNRPVHVRE
jgi:hypothetical protein